MRALLPAIRSLSDPHGSHPRVIVRSALAARSGHITFCRFLAPSDFFMMPRRLFTTLLGLCFILSSLTRAALHAETASPQTQDPLVTLILERLSWMDEVAEVKRAKSAPVADPAREEALLKAMEQKATEAKLSPTHVRAFFQGQIEAARAFQEEWLARPQPAEWKTRPVPDLTRDVRPQLDAIGTRILEQLSLPRIAAQRAAILTQAEQTMQQKGYSKAVIQPALRGLAAGLEAMR
ncbi:chorismate mutase, putative [Prosthecobacter debontii]|uniref:chorismate mutase n=2 Tax=Prosthecobacter debontii TaxID=48467 RepID=A0A1T4Z0Q0_9BACT|nr:chorismate mutase, putative [Prosthecobacter debontii]